MRTESESQRHASAKHQVSINGQLAVDRPSLVARELRALTIGQVASSHLHGEWCGHNHEQGMT